MVGIGFFAPFPLALMVPFMAGQSLAMGEAFGKGFQYGKRKISSMSNEEFNALNFQQLSESLATDYRVMIPSLVDSIKASDRLQDAVFKALADVIKDIPSQILDFFGDITGSTTTSTSASQQGKLQEVRFTPSHDREADLERTNAAIKKAQDILDKIIEEASHIVKKPTPPPPTFDNKSKNLTALDFAIGESKKKPFVSPPKSPSIIAHQPSLQKFNKPRAPNSICIQIRKFREELRALDVRENQLKNHPQFAKIRINFARTKAIVRNNITKLQSKYNTSACK